MAVLILQSEGVLPEEITLLVQPGNTVIDFSKLSTSSKLRLNYAYSEPTAIGKDNMIRKSLSRESAIKFQQCHFDKKKYPFWIFEEFFFASFC